MKQDREVETTNNRKQPVFYNNISVKTSYVYTRNISLVPEKFLTSNRSLKVQLDILVYWVFN